LCLPERGNMVIPSMVKTAGTSSESATSELKRAENRRETHAFASDSEPTSGTGITIRLACRRRKMKTHTATVLPSQKGILQFRRRSREEANQF